MSNEAYGLRDDPQTALNGQRTDPLDELARVRGANVKTIDRHFGHLAGDSWDWLRQALDARSGVFLAGS
jgi:hypothetical protein